MIAIRIWPYDVVPAAAAVDAHLMTINFPFTAINCLVNISEITGSFQFCTSHRNSEGLTAHCTTIFHGMPLKWPKKWLSVTHCTIFLATETGCLRSDTQIHESNTRTQSMFALWQHIHRLQIFCLCQSAVSVWNLAISLTRVFSPTSIQRATAFAVFLSVFQKSAEKQAYFPHQTHFERFPAYHFPCVFPSHLAYHWLIFEQ